MKKEDILFNGAETVGDTNEHWGGRIVFKANPGEFLIGNASSPDSFFLPRSVKGSLVSWEVRPDPTGDSICGYLLTAKVIPEHQQGELVKPNYERNTFIGGMCVPESEIREALKRIEEQPIHNWEVGDVFRFRTSGNIWRVKSLIGLNSIGVVCLWSSSDFEPSKNVYTFDLPDPEMIKLVEVG